MKFDYVHILLIVVVIVLLFVLVTKCNKKTAYTLTDTEYVYDTVYVTRTNYDTLIKHYVVNNNKIDTVFETVYTDTNYNLQVYSKCPTDSIKLDYNYIQTINEFKPDLKPRKNEIGIMYQYDKNNVINLVYGRNMGIITPFVSAGLDMNEKQPIIGCGIKVNF